MSTIDVKLEKKRLEIARKEFEVQVDSNYDSIYTGMACSACPVCKFCGVLVSNRMRVEHLKFSHINHYVETIKPLEDKIQSIAWMVQD